MKPTFLFSALLLLLADAAGAIEPPSSGRVDFTRDVRPILSDACYHCHGPDGETRKAKLRLDTRKGLFADHEGATPFAPKQLAASEAWKRITSDDPEELMPPPKGHQKLRPEQVAVLKRWIEQGAEFKEHWAFQKPVRPAAPPLANVWWPRNPIDGFIAAELEKRGMRPTPEAPKEVLLRRVALDLTGLPPTVAEVDAFLADTAPDALARAVDRYLGSPHYGEHMARYWLDVARYGDTHGLHLDNERSMWPYRDWVVRAFNTNLPFDEFTIEQLAGDLLPNATRDQQIASGFNRCNVTTSEGGAINEEFLYRYAVDRTDTTASVWMGLTAGCAQCHDHKFDPISQKEFYSLYSFFNSAADPAMDGNIMDTPPVLRLATPEQDAQYQKLAQDIAEVDRTAAQQLKALTYQDPATQEPRPEVKRVDTVWVDDDFPAGAKAGVAGAPLKWVTAEAATGGVKQGQRVLRRTGTGITQDYFDSITKPYYVPAQGKLYAYVWLDPQNPPKAIMLQWHSGGQWAYRANWGEDAAIVFGAPGTPAHLRMGALPKLGEWVRLEVPVERLQLKPGTVFDGVAFTQFDGTVQWDLAGVAYEENPAQDPSQSLAAWSKLHQGKLEKDLPANLQTIFRSVPPAQRTPEQEAAVQKYFLTEVCATTKEAFTPLLTARREKEAQRVALDKEITKTFIMQDLEPRRPAFVMLRGQYDKPGEPVQPATPAVFPGLRKAKPDAPATRLDLAKWLVSPEHPLTARVTVNRLWQQFFGQGLVLTAGDFGAQGTPPSHPELLDWLAVDFRESGWDVKALVRKMVLSAAYRQDSHTTKEGLEQDPTNRLLARGPRFRLDAEAIRDQALFVSGLLNPTLGGKGVRPYQPENVWEPVGFGTSNTRFYTQDHGAALYRRSLYTFWKRTAPPPNMMAFDTPSREQFCVRRERSNTPLQALVTMNDVQHVEAARALAERMMVEGGLLPADRLAYGFRLATSRRPLEPERTVLKGLWEHELERYAADTEAAGRAISVGESVPKPGLNASELAAYTMVANVILNMDETLNIN